MNVFIIPYNSYGAFVLKKKGLNKTTSIKLCLILKLFLRLNKLEGKGLHKN